MLAAQVVQSFCGGEALGQVVMPVTACETWLAVAGIHGGALSIASAIRLRSRRSKTRMEESTRVLTLVVRLRSCCGWVRRSTFFCMAGRTELARNERKPPMKEEGGIRVGPGGRIGGICTALL